MPNNIYVFIGPTIKRELAKKYLDATYLPPVQQGDVYNLVIKEPIAIAIIDGRFDSVPSVWHKEILWAMTNGIYVFGAASMGALRAVELNQFGMKGVGEIYHQYLSGALIDDDEVAVIHGPEELDFKPVSIALVDIRATFDLARKQNIISQSEYSSLLQVAKKSFYPNRNYKNIIQASCLKTVSKKTLLNWFQDNQYSQKEDDAIKLLKTINKYPMENKFEVDYKFESSEIWQRFAAKQQQTTAY